MDTAFPEVRKEVARGSTRRFLSLLCLLLLSSGYLLYAMALTLQPGWSLPECMGVAGFSLAEPAVPGLLETSGTFAACRAQAADQAAWIAVVGTGLVVAVALAVYWWWPAWRRWRGRLVPAEKVLVPTLDGAGMEPLTRHLEALARRAGVRRLPTFAVNPRRLTAGAVAIGRAGRYTICVDAGLVSRRGQEPWAFEAVLLHELAHVESRDVDVAYLTVALWRVVLLAGLVPFALLQISWLANDLLAGHPRVDWVEATPSLAKLAFGGFLVSLVYLAHTDILRSRELCADLDAVSAGAALTVWDPSRRAPGRRVHSPAWWVTMWRSHPPWQLRYEVLTGRRPVYSGASGWQVLLAIGAVAGVAGTVRAFPSWLLVATLYLLGPALVASWISSVPAKSPAMLRVSGWGLPHQRRSRRPVLPLAAMASLVMLVAALVVVDPLGAREGQEVKAAPTLPQQYRSDGTAPGLLLQDAGEVHGWLRDGGQEAVLALRRSLDVDEAALLTAQPGSLALADHCVQVEKALLLGEPLPPMPDPVGRVAWELMRTAAQEASELLCSPEPAASPERRRDLVGQGYAVARSAYDSLAAAVRPYHPEAFPAA